MRRVFIGMALGAAVGMSVSGVARAASPDDGAGYGGTASALQVRVSGEQVTVTGSGFAADSPVTVEVGDLSTTVTADDVGVIYAVLTDSGSTDSDESTVAASGTGADGQALTLTGSESSSLSGGEGALAGASVGAVGGLSVRRRKRRP